MRLDSVPKSITSCELRFDSRCAPVNFRPTYLTSRNTGCATPRPLGVPSEPPEEGEARLVWDAAFFRLSRPPTLRELRVSLSVSSVEGAPEKTGLVRESGVGVN